MRGTTGWHEDVSWPMYLAGADDTREGEALRARAMACARELMRMAGSVSAQEAARAAMCAAAVVETAAREATLLLGEAREGWTAAETEAAGNIVSPADHESAEEWLANRVWRGYTRIHGSRRGYRLLTSIATLWYTQYSCILSIQYPGIQGGASIRNTRYSIHPVDLLPPPAHTSPRRSLTHATTLLLTRLLTI